MKTLATAPIGVKGQITLPKKVRELLHLTEPGDLVGFVVDEKARTIRITRMDVVPDDEPFTKADYQALDTLRRAPGRQTFDSAQDFLDDLQQS
jgi:AbrB family looped-hinge helix DNA binding protein